MKTTQISAFQRIKISASIAQSPQSPSFESRGSRHPIPRLPSGDQSAVEPPGPIPNPEVKRRSANGSETIGLVRVGRRQVYARPRAIGAGHFFLRPRGPGTPRAMRVRFRSRAVALDGGAVIADSCTISPKSFDSMHSD